MKAKLNDSDACETRDTIQFNGVHDGRRVWVVVKLHRGYVTIDTSCGKCLQLNKSQTKRLIKKLKVLSKGCKKTRQSITVPRVMAEVGKLMLLSAVIPIYWRFFTMIFYLVRRWVMVVQLLSDGMR